MADAGRVIAGSARGTRLAAPGSGTRPLGDRVKQTLFAILEPDLPGARVLDLFAGSGAAGIEALSRGAAAAVFVERDPRAVAAIRENLARAGFGRPAALIVPADVLAFIGRPLEEHPPFDIVIADPPYAEPEALDPILRRLGAPIGPLVDGARVVVKHFWRTQLPDRVGLLASERVRRFGETALTFYRRRPAEPGPTEDRAEAR
ncbi:MAG TPA: 16S rRNA (guanine(966)-N(2))-methyltransferase RsmD [Candidatus Limnocylindrales bacterium]|nr:16S rRNA (guanine(966)-N(2))-methyltransferase RsmD [Candidatus Limnocylindrales bacterium]